MILQPPPLGYDSSFENERNRNLEAEDLMNRKKRQDVEIATNERLIISSPNGTRYKIVVSDAGVLSATSL